MELQTPNEEAMIRVAVADLDDEFTSVDRSHIEATVRRVVRDLFVRARVKIFVGIIAERQARTELQHARAESESPVDHAVRARQSSHGVSDPSIGRPPR